MKKKSNRIRRRRSRRSTSGSSRRRSRCVANLRKKISINMREMKQGRYVSPAQAVAVAYSQIRKRHPSCRRIFKKTK